MNGTIRTAIFATVAGLAVAATDRGALAQPVPDVRRADQNEAVSAPSRTPEQVTARFQFTAFVQGYPAFDAAYDAPESLPSKGMTRQTTSATAYFGARLPWRGGELYVNPEYFQGFGINNTYGIAGFTNGEAQKAGSRTGRVHMARAFVRQDVALGPELEWFESDVNQLAGYRPSRRLTLTFGHFSALDLFQTSAYAGDPRRQFMNWSIWGPGAWDYAANSRGYTNGLIVDWVTSDALTLRYGAFLMPSRQNGDNLVPRLDNVNHAFEIDVDYQINGRPGSFKPFAFYTQGRMGRFRDALTLSAATGLDINDTIETTRRFGNEKWGLGLLVDQELTDHIGAFLRASWNDGRTEEMAFTQIQRSLAVGLSFKGAAWGMPGHSAGIAGVTNGLAKPQQRFLAAGGRGFIVGDGQLVYAPERIMEAWYEVPLVRDNVFLAASYQFVENPGYNDLRTGPVHVFGLRLHARR